MIAKSTSLDTHACKIYICFRQFLASKAIPLFDGCSSKHLNICIYHLMQNFGDVSLILSPASSYCDSVSVPSLPSGSSSVCLVEFKLRKKWEEIFKK